MRRHWLAGLRWSAFVLLVGLFASGPLWARVAHADESGGAVKHETYNGYFVSNKFEPDAAQSFVAIADATRFDEVFGVAFVMRDKSRRLPPGAFADQLVFATIKRGAALWEYKVQEVTEKEGRLEIKYSAKAMPQEGATFAVPLILSVPKKAYESVSFVENDKLVKTLSLAK